MSPYIDLGSTMNTDVHGGKTMEGNMEYGGGQRWSRWRIVAWVTPGLVLLVPLVAMQFTKKVRWGLGDFVAAGVLLYGAVSTYEFVAKRMGNFAYRAAVGVAVAAALFLVWVNLAVGVIGKEGNPANLMFIGVLAVGMIGAFIARFQPQGMARVLVAMALAQTLVGVIALIARWGSDGPIWPRDVVMLTGFFAALWLMSAWLFRRASRGAAERRAV